MVPSTKPSNRHAYNGYQFGLYCETLGRVTGTAAAEDYPVVFPKTKFGFGLEVPRLGSLQDLRKKTKKVSKLRKKINRGASSGEEKDRNQNNSWTSRRLYFIT